MDNTGDFYSLNMGSIPVRRATFRERMKKLLLLLLILLGGCVYYPVPNGVYYPNVCWQQIVYQGSMYNVSCNPGDSLYE